MPSNVSRAQRKELESLLELSRLLSRDERPADSLPRVVKILPGAFSRTGTACCRIDYDGVRYANLDIKAGAHALTSPLTVDGVHKGDLQLFFIEDERTSFNLEEINIVDVAVKLLGNYIERIEHRRRLRQELEFKRFSEKILKMFVAITPAQFERHMLPLCREVADYLGVDSLQLIIPQDEGIRNYNVVRNRELPVDWFKKTLAPLLNRNLPILTAQRLTGYRPPDKLPVASLVQTLREAGMRFFYQLPLEFSGDRVGGLFLISRRGRMNENCRILLELFQEMTANLVSSAFREKQILLFGEAIYQSPWPICLCGPQGRVLYCNEPYLAFCSQELGEALGDLAPPFKRNRENDEFWSLVKERNPWYEEIEGTSGKWESYRVTALGNPDGYFCVLEDISDRKRAEKRLRDTTAKLTQAHNTLLNEEKMASIGRLAAGLAHEINNPLAFVMSNHKTLKRYWSGFEEIYESHESCLCQKGDDEGAGGFKIDDYRDIRQDVGDILEENDQGIRRIREIVEHLRSFSRIDQGKQRGPLNLRESIDSTVMMLRNEAKYTAKINVECDTGLTLNANGGELNQILLNLIMNAIQAVRSNHSEGMGRVGIKAIQEGKTIQITIIDDGPGIPEEIRNQIFEPFFTTKPVGQGTGLGLSITYDLVRKNGGTITVDGPPGGGTRFILSFSGEENP